MVTRLLHHIRMNVIAYLALFVALGAGGGYAVAASNDKTITVCADKKSGVLHLKTRGRCKSSQTRLTWNGEGPQGIQGAAGQQGAQGVPGAPGLAGAQGASAVSVWAYVAGNGAVIAGQGLTVQRTMAGTYQVTVTDPTCASETSAPVVSESDDNPPNGQMQGSGAFAVAWYESTQSNQQFTVFTGIVMNGKFSATDHTFDIHDACP
jgi:hypothetical protein